MKLFTSIFTSTMMLLSCNAPKTVYISNKTGSPVTLLVDSSYQNTRANIFIDSLNGLRIEKRKVFEFGEGKWTKKDKTDLQELIKHTKILKDGSTTAIRMPHKTKVSLISFNVEELWVNIR